MRWHKGWAHGTVDLGPHFSVEYTDILDFGSHTSLHICTYGDQGLQELLHLQVKILLFPKVILHTERTHRIHHEEMQHCVWKGFLSIFVQICLQGSYFVKFSLGVPGLVKKLGVFLSSDVYIFSRIKGTTDAYKSLNKI